MPSHERMEQEEDKSDSTCSELKELKEANLWPQKNDEFHAERKGNK